MTRTSSPWNILSGTARSLVWGFLGCGALSKLFQRCGERNSIPCNDLLSIKLKKFKLTATANYLIHSSVQKEYNEEMSSSEYINHEKPRSSYCVVSYFTGEAAGGKFYIGFHEEEESHVPDPTTGTTLADWLYPREYRGFSGLEQVWKSSCSEQNGWCAMQKKPRIKHD